MISQFFTPKTGLSLWLYIIGSLVFGVLVFFLLGLVPKKARKPIIVAIVFLSGCYLSLEFLIPHDNVLTQSMPNISNYMLLISAFTIFLGLGSLFLLHGKRAVTKNENTINSWGFFIGFFAIIIFGILSDNQVKGAEAMYNIFFNGIYIAMTSTMFSLVAFYIVSASYRAFKVRNTETSILFLSTAIIMLALIPIGASLTSFIPANSPFAFLKLESLGYWILISPNMAVQRAIAFGVGIGSFATSLRIWLSLEKGNFYDKEL